MKSKQNIFWLCILIVFSVAALKGAVELGRIALLEAKGPLDADSTIYFTLGRAILNGFRLYTSDFFEVQPPGIFLLTATSLFITGDERLATGFVVFAMVALPVIIALFAAKESRSADRLFRTTLTLLAFILGVLITLYLEERAPTIETQLFGAFFGALFTVAMAWYPGKFNIQWSLLCGLLLLLSIGMKEPFLITNLAAATLLARDRRHFVHAFVLPLAIGGLIGIVVLFSLGILQPYVESLAITFTSRSGSTSARVFGPLWFRQFAIYNLHQNMTSIYPASPLFAYVIWVLWSFFPAYRGGEKVKVRSVSSTLFFMVAFGAAAWIMEQTYEIFLLFYASFNHRAFQDPFFGQHAVMGFIWGLILFIPSAMHLYHRGLLRWLFLALFALALTSLAVGISVYSGNHFAFAIPVYAAIILLFIQHSAVHAKVTPIFLAVSGVTVATMLLFVPNPKHMLYLQNRLGFTHTAQKERIERLDSLMNNCGLERYYSEGMVELAMAKHSPWGPLIMHFDFIPPDHPLHVATAQNVFSYAQLLVTTEDYENPFPPRTKDLVIAMLRQKIPQEFTKDPPPCAAPFVPMEGFTLWFRKDLQR